MKQHNSLNGFHSDIKFILKPVQSDIKNITVKNVGYVDETVHAVFTDNTEWILQYKNGKDWVRIDR